MRTVALALGIIGGALLLCVGLPLTIARPYGVVVLLAGGLALYGAFAQRRRKTKGGMFLLAGLLIATFVLVVTMTLTGAAGLAAAVAVGCVLLLLAAIFAFAAPEASGLNVSPM